jgi:hypothetical protein
MQIRQNHPSPVTRRDTSPAGGTGGGNAPAMGGGRCKSVKAIRLRSPGGCPAGRLSGGACTGTWRAADANPSKPSVSGHPEGAPPGDYPAGHAPAHGGAADANPSKPSVSGRPEGAPPGDSPAGHGPAPGWAAEAITSKPSVSGLPEGAPPGDYPAGHAPAHGGRPMQILQNHPSPVARRVPRRASIRRGMHRHMGGGRCKIRQNHPSPVARSDAPPVGGGPAGQCTGHEGGRCNSVRSIRLRPPGGCPAGGIRRGNASAMEEGGRCKICLFHPSSVARRTTFSCVGRPGHPFPQTARENHEFQKCRRCPQDLRTFPCIPHPDI